MGGRLLGWRTVCAVEFAAYPRRVLLARQRDGLLDRFPIWDDVRTFAGKPWRGHVDVVSGGFPCQDISCAGKGAGLTGDRSGLWVEMARIVREVGPRYVFVENSPMLTSRGLGVVLGDLASLGYDARWGVLGACDAGAPHKRERIWILATNANSERRREEQECVERGEDQAVSRYDGASEHVADSEEGHAGQPQQQPCRNGQRTDREEVWGKLRHEPARCGWWSAEPSLDRVADGIPARVDRLAALGNGQVPAVAALAWRTLGGPG